MLFHSTGGIFDVACAAGVRSFQSDCSQDVFSASGLMCFVVYFGLCCLVAFCCTQSTTALLALSPNFMRATVYVMVQIRKSSTLVSKTLVKRRDQPCFKVQMHAQRLLDIIRTSESRMSKHANGYYLAVVQIPFSAF